MMKYIPYAHNSPVKQWNKRFDFTKEDAKRVFASLVMFEGCVGFYRRTKDNRLLLGVCALKTRESFILHQIFADLAHYAWRVLPSQFYRSRNDTSSKIKMGKQFYTNYGAALSGHKDLFTDLFRYSPTYITSRPSIQPTIGFLNDCSLFAKIVAFRLGMDAEGSVRSCFEVDIKPTRFRVEPVIQFAQTNKNIINELCMLVTSIGFDEWHPIRAPAVWSGYSGIRTYKVSSINHFKNIGGFVTDVSVKGDIGTPRTGVHLNAGFKKQSVLSALIAYLNKYPHARRHHSVDSAKQDCKYYWKKFCELRDYYER